MIRTIDREAPPDAPPMRERLADLGHMTATQLRVRYAEVFGEQSRSGNRQWLLRRIAWRIQFDTEGSFAQRADEQARALAFVTADRGSGPDSAGRATLPRKRSDARIAVNRRA